MAATIRDISLKANVSAMTVSRVLNPRSGAPVAPETRERILSIAQELDYCANHTARALVTGRTWLIALGVPRIAATHYGAVAGNIRALARDDGYDIVLREVPSGPPGAGAVPPARQFDGGLLCDGDARGPGFLGSGLDPRAPLVSFGTESEDADITVDLYPAARAAVEHLVQGGRRRIACCMRDSVLQEGVDARLHAFVEVMEEAGLQPEFIGVDEATRPASRRAFREYVLRADFPDAVFCESDEIAFGVHRAAHILGLIVPAELFLVGGIDSEEAEYHVPSISSIRQPVDDICRAAWQMLRQRIEQPDAALEPRGFVAEFVIRESSR